MGPVDPILPQKRNNSQNLKKLHQTLSAAKNNPDLAKWLKLKQKDLKKIDKQIPIQMPFMFGVRTGPSSTEDI